MVEEATDLQARIKSAWNRLPIPTVISDYPGAEPGGQHEKTFAPTANRKFYEVTSQEVFAEYSLIVTAPEASVYYLGSYMLRTLSRILASEDVATDAWTI